MRKSKTAGENEKNQIHFAVTTQEAGSQRAVTTGQKKSASKSSPRTRLHHGRIMEVDSSRPNGCSLSGHNLKNVMNLVLAR